MNTDQALNLIDQVLVQFRGTRQEHEALIQAMVVIQAAIKGAQKEEEVKS